MLIEGTLLKVAAGITAALCIGLALSGWMLKKSWQDNATLAANQEQLTATVRAQAEAYGALETEKQQAEEITVENVAAKEVITRVEEKIKYVVREIIKKVPAEDCLNQPMPGDLLACLQSDDCGPGSGDPADVPAGGARAGNP